MNALKKDGIKPAAATGLNTLSVAGYVLGIAGVILILIAVSIISSAAGKPGSPTTQASIADNITVSDLTTDSATISFTTVDARVIDVIIYDREGKITGVFSDSVPVERHSIRIDPLYPDSFCGFQLLSADASGRRDIPDRYSFTTLKPPPVISNVRASKMPDSCIRINWETDLPVATDISYRAEGDTIQYTISENISTTSHEAVLRPLESGLLYAFTIRVNNAQTDSSIAQYEGLLSLKDGVRIFQRAPDFMLPSVTGQNVQLISYRGRIVLLAFWSMNCPSCQKKVLLLQEAFKRSGNGEVGIITIHGPAREDMIKSYCSSHGLTLPVLLDLQANVGSAYNVIQLPAVFILDQSGVIISDNPEFESIEELESLIGRLLSARLPTTGLAIESSPDI